MGDFRFRRGALQPTWPLKVSNSDKTDYDGLYDLIYEERASIMQDLFILIMTNPGAWLMDPDLGVGLPTVLFELHNSPALEEFKSRLKTQVNSYLPVVKLVKVEFVHSNQDIDNLKSNLIVVYTVDLLAIEEQLNIEFDQAGEASLVGLDRFFKIDGFSDGAPSSLVDRGNIGV